jgi:hypothetical protein
VGSSSRMDMYTIMPATKENMTPNASWDLQKQCWEVEATRQGRE